MAQGNEGEKFAVETSAATRQAFWFTENVTANFGVKMSLKRIIYDGKSQFQDVQVVETHQFGKTLVLDGQTQSALADEYVYHETLVHPAMMLAGTPKNVFIGGGGEFATAREVLKHSSVEKCVMVDIDELACDICRKEMPEWNDGAYEDSRFEVYYEDAYAWLQKYAQNPEHKKFDVIIMDICDPIEAGPGYKLYTKEFYDFVKSIMSENGVLVTQSGPCAVFNASSECFTTIHNTLKQAYPVVMPFAVDVPSFGTTWGFNLALVNSTANVEINELVLESKVSELDERIERQVSKPLRFLDGVSFKGIFCISKSIRKECEAEDRVMTVDNPVFMYSS